MPDPSPQPIDQAAARAALATIHQHARLNRILVAAILAVFAVMAWWTWVYFEQSFTQERFQAAAKAEAAKVIPQLVTQSGKAVTNTIVPALTAEATKQFPTELPKLEKALGQEVDGLVQAMMKRGERLLDDLVGDGLAKHMTLVKADFPELATEAGRKALLDRAVGSSIVQADAVIEAVWKRCGADVQALQAEMDAFAPATDKRGEDELMRDFIHLWLVLADHQLTKGDALPDLDKTSPKGGAK